ncbi:sugar (Glycoside-Pentoside-Hexuronide) transporter [Propionibacterium cyclohexanicum]|uniref:Sugar (Glycoside-Pentoside-Hexuronide) transporter n=1 Tax=Propionibacterium cyclohexanicum TaxID=64702 RepID=A0A1H9R2M7_9ACTN|nr:glycoside-pentoside-hexuronide (GPH):cation symporter [Propionibacterium cyclohexanicum]SER66950.1 sugar (Glycoside-Pentoside-Hexuronide) transporter [Propionibacterium cyclohexanicum]
MDLVHTSVPARIQALSVVIAGFGQSIIITTVTTFILVYLLEYVHLSVAAMAVVTSIITAAKVFDALSDPIMGTIVDRTRSRWGKMRPYILFSALPVAGLTTALFAVPQAPQTTQLVYFGICFFAWGIAYTACDVPYWGVIGSAFSDPAQRNKAISQVRAAGSISLGVATLGMPWFAALLSDGPTTTAHGWTLAVAVSSFAGMGLYLLAFVNTRERTRPDGTAALTFRILVTNFVHNTPLLLVLLGSTIGFGRSIIQAGGAVFAVVAYGSEKSFTAIGAAVIVGMVVAALATPLLLRHMTSKDLMIRSSLAAALLYLVMFLAGFQNFALLLAFVALSGVALGIFMVIQVTLIADAVDDMERRTGIRNDGISFSTLTFTGKLMNALSVMVFGALVVVSGYHSGAQITRHMQNVLFASITLVPAASCLLSVVPFCFYRLSTPVASGNGSSATA